MSLARLAFCALLVSVDASGFLSRQGSHSHGRARAFAGLRFSPKDPAAHTLLALDTNHDGRIDPDEVASFARSQGLDAEAATQEFSSIDVNGDGVLDSTELTSALGVSPPTKLASTDVTNHVVAEPPSSAAAFTTYDGGIEQVGSSAALEPPARVEDAALPALEEARTDSSTMEASKSELISDKSRASVRMAAQKVAEDLALEENEENEAQKLDREAAEVRASFSSLSKATIQKALGAGSTAAHTKSSELLANIAKLEEEAQKAEVRAAALRAKSKLEMEQGTELMKIADQALKRN